jgi:hypothetical protein
MNSRQAAATGTGLSPANRKNLEDNGIKVLLANVE